MIARSFRSVGWVAGVGAAALGCYMLSLQVAAERADLTRVEGRILQTRQAIRNLQTELGTRGRMSQLESWNADVLALSAPVAGQYVENEVVLARLETRSDPIADATVRMASAETDAPAPATAAPAAAQPAARPAVGSAPQAPSSSAPVVRRASLDSTPPARSASAVPRPAATRTAAPIRTASLLDARTARELGETARAERRQPAAAARPADRPAARSERSPARTQPKD
jgi:hypothetical protein